ncbi:hypothetical protein KGM_202198 [Danaus plexippus plexippus]|uniref:Uncharacterized protein n=1 Tax=Danaus plexippus plexippus TaxID=278856 RepID=A0A212FIQ9_DANPL|nr:hypothetical protein KGM_202198 [Danaus plexippus plexippus]
MIKLESPEVHMSLPRAPDPAALAAYWAEYEDLCRQITTTASNDDDDNHYEAKDNRNTWPRASPDGDRFRQPAIWKERSFSTPAATFPLISRPLVLSS